MNIINWDIFKQLENGLYIWDSFRQSVVDAQINEKSLAVVFINFDCVKHSVPEDIYKENLDRIAAKAIERVSFELKPGDIIVRMNSGEILIFITNLDTFNSVEKAAGKITAALRLPFDIGDYIISLRIYAGCMIFPIDGKNAEELIGNAAIASYSAKDSDSDRIAYSGTVKQTGDILQELKLTNRLYGAIERSELELYYQPIIDIKSESIVGFEALMRWNSPLEGAVEPLRFIPIAEKTDLIFKLDEWAIRTACRQNKSWQDMGLGGYYTTVNITARQFEDSRLMESINEILNEIKLSPDFLELEITESSAIRKMDDIKENIRRLADLGINTAIDDFGISYSSLNYIKQLPINIVKIDKSFIDGIGLCDRDEAVLRAVIALIKNLNLQAVAEGVETKEQIDFLTEEGCFTVQGFYYYKPMPAREIEKLLKLPKKSRLQNMRT